MLLQRYKRGAEFLTLSTMSVAELSELGYDDEQVQTIRTYQEGEDAFTHFYGTYSAKSAAVLTFKYGIAGSTNTKKTVMLAYDMSWSERPFYYLTDSFAVAWTAANSSSVTLNTKVDEVSVAVQYGSDSSGESITPVVTSNHLQQIFR